MPKTTPQKIGLPAPNFTLEDSRGTSHALRDVLARQNGVVLIFYPGDMTPGCTMQLCTIRDDWKQFERAGIAVYGVNHAGKESHERFINAHAFPFPLLIDEKLGLSEKYGATKKIFSKKVIHRTVVGIAKDGTIVFYKRGMPKTSDIMKAFAA